MKTCLDIRSYLGTQVLYLPLKQPAIKFRQKTPFSRKMSASCLRGLRYSNLWTKLCMKGRNKIDFIVEDNQSCHCNRSPTAKKFGIKHP